MKKIVYILGGLFLSIVIILNLLFTANLDASEHIEISFNSISYIVGVILIGMLIYFASKAINKYLCTDVAETQKKVRKSLFIGSLVIYIIFNILWVIFIRPAIVGDQIHACNLAQTFYRGNLEEFLPNMTYAGISLKDYMQAYHQQISLSFVFSIFFRIIHFDEIGVLRALNVLGNILIVVALYKISCQLSKKYKTNKVLLLTLILTFISLAMLSTFIYGDIPSLALCLFSVYFMMRYTETKKVIYPIFASVFTMIAYMMRMNSLIFIIATVIYLLMNLFKEFKENSYKQTLVNLLIIAIYIVFSILPSSLVKTYYLNKYDLDKNKAYPNISYFLMAMEEGPRANGWYNESIGEPALKNSENIKEEYLSRIKSRLSYFSQNVGYTFDFYTMKIASMWTENTYSAIRNNMEGQTNSQLEKIVKPLTFYQKALLILTCLCSLVVLIQNRKNLSLDIFTYYFCGRFCIPYIMGSKIKVYNSIHSSVNTYCIYKY